ncbi:MAG: three-Cys-motif partner protein TcmP [Phycisphaerae bacterium]|nr:three-Cys-motif partner protein TcmP [Phycisphaerae bacterium]
MAKDINKESYDEATLTKLDIFEQYLLAWLPVFIQTPYTGEVMICDFFAGSGQDPEKVPGSPLRILRTIDKYRDDIFSKNITVRIIFNEAAADKHDELKAAVNSSFDQNSWKEKVSVLCFNGEFQNLFRQQYEQLKRQPNLLFIDQYGVKEVTGEIFQMLVELNKTDFLFFMSSSAMKRFAGTPEFKTHFPDIDPAKIADAKYEDIHRIMLEYYQGKIPDDNETKLYPFTLKKGANIYGLVFGSKHLLGVEKFLDLAWDQNKINGEANFDIDEDVQKKEATLFDSMPDYKRPKTKREIFEDCLENFIISHREVTNRDIYYFTLDHGHPKSHARECVSRLKKDGKVEYKGNIGFSYDRCVKKEPKIIKVKNNG